MTSAGTNRRVLIVGTDGLRPDLFDPELMPTFGKLITEGAWINNYHAVYPTHTGVNLTTLATGCAPGKHGIIANVFRYPGMIEDDIVDTSNYRHIAQLDRSTGGNAIKVPTLGDLIDERGKRLAIAAASTPGRSILWNRNFPYRVVNSNSAYGRADLYSLRDKLGEAPEPEIPPKRTHLDYIARAVTDIYLTDEEIEVIVLWLVEPDSALHYFGVGSPESKAAMQACDDALAHVLDAMDRRGIRDQFDIIYLSDHGHSSVRLGTTLGEYLDRANRNGLDIPSLVTASDFIYPNPEDRKPSLDEITQLVGWLQRQPWTGAIFAADEQVAALPGVFPLSLVWGTTDERAPLLAVSPTWSDEINEFGTPGVVEAMTENAAKRSSHGSASPYELHAIAAFNGPSFVSGQTSDIPAGGIDIAPTVQAILGAQPSEWMDGRVIWEVFDKPRGEPGNVTDEVIEPRTRTSNGFEPRLRIHRVGEQTYLHAAENGNGT